MKKKFGNTETVTVVVEPEVHAKRDAGKAIPSSVDRGVAAEPPPTIKRVDLPLISTLPKPHMLTAKEAFEELDMQTYYFDEATGKKRRREDRIKELKTKIEQICSWSHQPGYRHGELFLTSKYSEGRESMDTALLMENGVTAQQIKDSKKRGEGYVTNTFGRIADKED